MTNAVWSTILEKAASSFKKLDPTPIVENELLGPTTFDSDTKTITGIADRELRLPAKQ